MRTRGRRRSRAAAALFSLALVAGCTAEESPQPLGKLETPLLLFGVDGATWDVIGPLLAQQRLPNFARLMEAGSHAPLAHLDVFAVLFHIVPALVDQVIDGGDEQLELAHALVEHPGAPPGDLVLVGQQAGEQTAATWCDLAAVGLDLRLAGLPGFVNGVSLRHGTDGAAPGNTIPILGGQRADYLLGAMTAYRSGDRDFYVMNFIARAYDEGQTAAIAGWFAR